MPKAKKKAKKSSRITKFFSAVGSGVLKTGGSASKAARRIGRAVTKREAPKKADEVTRRLQELKRLEALREEELVEARKLRGEEHFKRRAELKRPLSERIAESFYIPLKRPALRMVGFFKGLDQDLFRANMKVAPERYVALMLGISIVAGVFTLVLAGMLLPLPLALLFGIVVFMFTLLVSRTHPKSRAKARVFDVNRTIPYALRHMATQLSSGIGLPETMTSVSKADYGALSEEFGRVIRDMHAGLSMEEALTAMDKRMESEPLRRAIRQIQRTLRTGGDLARILNTLADETSFELRMKLRDYTQSLNMLTMFYMFVSAIIPAMLLIVVGMMGAFPPEGFAMLYLLLLPSLLVWFIRMIKRMEPRV